ncbi:hypothetical protein [Streptomyces sp. NPDC058657]|uniref:hypothetical protein n=1 Tax=unclassified Streptomyces TaxID=2593676 RepID=UPI0036560A46
MNTVKIFGREPVAWLTLFAVCVKLFSAFVLEVDPNVQAWVNAVAAAAMGVAIALIVDDGAVAAVLGLVQAALALAVGLGADLTTVEQGLILSALSLALGGYERTQVTAPVPAKAVRAAPVA